MKKGFWILLLLWEHATHTAYEDMTLGCALGQMMTVLGLYNKKHSVWNDIYDYDYVITQCMVEVEHVIKNDEIDDSLEVFFNNVVVAMKPIEEYLDDFAAHQDPFFFEPLNRVYMHTMASKIENIMGSRWSMLKSYARQPYKIKRLKCFKNIPRHKKTYDINQFLPEILLVKKNSI